MILILAWPLFIIKYKSSDFIIEETKGIFLQGPFSSSSYWFNKMYYSDIGPHVRGQGGKILMYEE